MEKITLLCSLCDKEIETTHNEYIKRKAQTGDKCWICGHGDLSIIFGEYSELALTIHRAAEQLRRLDPEDALRLSQPITDIFKKNRKSSS
jgi:hypothetical protein